MGIRHNVEEGLEKYEIMKINGQPMDEDLNLLAKELTNAAGSIATQNGGYWHRLSATSRFHALCSA